MAGKTISQTPPLTDEKYPFSLFPRYDLIINCFDSITTAELDLFHCSRK
jgi:hypothetical protein